MKILFKITLLSACVCWGYSLAAQSFKQQPRGASLATTWADMTIKIMTKAPKNTPTYGSRAIGYMGLTMYETVVYSSAKHRSVAGFLTKQSFTKPKKKKEICWELALNAGQAYMLKALYGYTKKTKPIDSLEQAIHEQYAARLSADVVQRSEAYGKAVATKIYEWSKTDGGYEAYQRNFPIEYKRPKGSGLWIPPVIGQVNSLFPLHPYWGGNRTFLERNGNMPTPKPLVYSKDTTSLYYTHYKEVFERKKTLTEDDRAIVMWWSDDPSETCAPPGHSYNLATIAIRQSEADLVKAAETYARVGMAVADAFVCCWKTKFEYLVERPSTYIRASVDKQSPWNPWLPFFKEPPFPSFYSGHAVQSGAAATVLTDLYGSDFAFTDDTHALHPTLTYEVANKLPDGIPTSDNYTQFMPTYKSYTLKYKPRRFRSFWDAAKECAESRLMGGIHTRYDNEVGLEEGTKIGRNVNALRWH